MDAWLKQHPDRSVHVRFIFSTHFVVELYEGIRSTTGTSEILDEAFEKARVQLVSRVN